MATKVKAKKKKEPKRTTPVFKRVQCYQCKCSEIVSADSYITDLQYYECTVCSTLPTEDDMYEDEEY